MKSTGFHHEIQRISWCQMSQGPMVLFLYIVQLLLTSLISDDGNAKICQKHFVKFLNSSTMCPAALFLHRLCDGNITMTGYHHKLSLQVRLADPM